MDEWRIQQGLVPFFDHHLTEEERIAKRKLEESLNEDIRPSPPKERPPPANKKQSVSTKTRSRRSIPGALPGTL